MMSDTGAWVDGEAVEETPVGATPDAPDGGGGSSSGEVNTPPAPDESEASPSEEAEPAPALGSSDPAAAAAVTSTDPAGTSGTGLTAPSVVAGLGGQAAPPDGADVVVAGVNSADGQPAVVDPTYVDPPDVVTSQQENAIVADLRSDPNATEAERSSGERTVTGTPPIDDTPVDAAMVGMATGRPYRSAGEVRVVLMDRPFTADGKTGGRGDYLAEDGSGRRFVLSQAELDDGYRAI